MSSIHKFQFDVSFDPQDPRPAGEPQAAAPEPEPIPAPEPEPPPPPPEPTFSLADLQAQVQMARQQGIEMGRAEGRQQAEVDAERALTDALNRVDQHMVQLIQAEAAGRHRRDEDTRRLALGIVRKLFPTLVRRHGLAEVEGTVATLLDELRDEPKLVIRVHESWLEAMRERIEGMAARHGFAGVVTVLADPRCGELDCRADWGDGGAERDVGALLAEIDRITGRVLDGFAGLKAGAA
ncbi:MAG TPA: hypothetical protein VED40_09765 [Azospirillaceae bacterium]|nr:hypothetical protein [Azospirillaceae bacterium]